MEKIIQQLILLLLLLSFYCAPNILIFVFAFIEIVTSPSNKIDEDGLILKIVKELGTNSGMYTNSIHQMILPVAAAITAINYKSLPLRGLSLSIFIIPLITIFISIIDALLFNIQSVLVAPIKGMVSQYFIGIASNLSVYVMMLVGLHTGDSSKSGGSV